MEIYYGDKLVAQKEAWINDKKVVYCGKKLLVLSKSDYTEIPITKERKLILWGKIFAIIQNNGKYFPSSTKADRDSKLKAFFKKANLDDAISRIEGDFIGCLIKADEEAVVFADSFNRRDIFYSFQDDGVAASIDLKAPIFRKNKSYDQASLTNLLSIYGMYAPKKHTIYKDIRKLGVGERLVFSRNNARLEKTRFSPLETANYGISELTEYADILEEAVRIRGSKSCNWVYLSSGWDSTALLALLVKNFGSSRVKAVIGKMEYAARSKDANLFEIKRAKKFADYFSVDLKVVPLDYTGRDSVKYWEEIKPFLRDNHIYADNSCNFHLLSKYIAKKASKDDAIFCGEISDGAHNLGFAQFMTILEHPVLEFREYSDKMSAYLFGPTFFNSILKGGYSQDAIYQLLRSRLNGQKFDDGAKLDERERKLKFVASFFLRDRRIPFYSLENQRILTENGAKMHESEMVKTYLKDCIDKIEPSTIYSWILHLYNSFHWQGSTVKSISGTALDKGLSLRLPFWDKRLQKFFSAMPENWGRGLELRPTKYPLKWMLQNKIDYPKHLQVGPHSYLYDVNPNFSLEAELLYGSALAPYFRKTMKNYPFEEILDKRYFNLSYLKRLTDDYVSGVELQGGALSDFYNLAWFCWIGWY